MPRRDDCMDEGIDRGILKVFKCLVVMTAWMKELVIAFYMINVFQYIQLHNGTVSALVMAFLKVFKCLVVMAAWMK